MPGVDRRIREVPLRASVAFGALPPAALSRGEQSGSLRQALLGQTPYCLGTHVKEKPECCSKAQGSSSVPMEYREVWFGVFFNCE